MEHVNLPRGLEREHVHYHGHDYSLRGSETRTLTTVGAFRAVPASDLRDSFDQPLDPNRVLIFLHPMPDFSDPNWNTPALNEARWKATMRVKLNEAADTVTLPADVLTASRAALAAETVLYRLIVVQVAAEVVDQRLLARGRRHRAADRLGARKRL